MCVGNWSFSPNNIDKMKSRVGNQLYWLILITIPCNNWDYFKNNEYFIVRLYILILTMSQTIFAYSASVYLFFILILRPSFSRFCKSQHSFFFCCWWLNLQSHISTSQHNPWLTIQLTAIDSWYEHIPWSNRENFWSSFLAVFL